MRKSPIHMLTAVAPLGSSFLVPADAFASHRGFAHAANRAPSDVAGLRVAISPGFRSEPAGITFLMAAENSPQPTGPGFFRGLIGLLLDLCARGPHQRAQAGG
jgi:hypothetical protein